MSRITRDAISELGSCAEETPVIRLKAAYHMLV